MVQERPLVPLSPAARSEVSLETRPACTTDSQRVCGTERNIGAASSQQLGPSVRHTAFGDAVAGKN